MVPEIWSATDKMFCHFGPFFCPFTPPPPNNPKNQNFERYHHFTQCTKNHDHMLNCS